MRCLKYNYIDKRRIKRTIEEGNKIDGRYRKLTSRELSSHSLGVDNTISQEMHFKCLLARAHYMDNERNTSSIVPASKVVLVVRLVRLPHYVSMRLE